MSITPTPPTDPPPAPPPLNVPPSRARRQLAARLALHSQQRADAEAEGSIETGLHPLSPEKASSLPKLRLSDDSNDFEHDPLADPVSYDDGDDYDDPNGISFGKPLGISQSSHLHESHEDDEALIRESLSRSSEIEATPGNVAESSKTHSDSTSKTSLSPSPPGGARHLDLDDFANSPAADADDASDDVEMRVALG